MKQSAPMKRTPMKRAAPMARTAKPATGKPKAKKCANRACRADYLPDPKRLYKNWCSDDCALVIALDKLAKQKAAKEKAERAETKRRKAEGMTHKEHLKLTEKLVNRCVVLRDWNDGCISCHMPSHYDGIWTASHFKSVGSNSALRFNLRNIHKGCEQCNLFKSGNIAEYEKRLLLKRGPEVVDWLKNHTRSREYTKEWLMRAQAIARRYIKRREKRLGIK